MEMSSRTTCSPFHPRPGPASTRWRVSLRSLTWASGQCQQPRRPDAKSDRCRLPPSIWTWTVATSPQRRRWRQPTASARTTNRTSAAAAISSRARRSAAGSAAAAAAATTTGAWALAPALAPASAPTGRAPRDVWAVRVAAAAAAAAVAPAASTLWWCAEAIPSGAGTNHTAVLASAASMLAATFPCLTAITCAVVIIPGPHHIIIPRINLWL
jgi:hypothetical protein